VRIPIACTLAADDRVERGEEWRTLAHELVIDRDRVSRKRLRLRLDPERPDVLAVAIGLARREMACCGFFEFTFVLAAAETWLEIAVPPDASGILDTFETAPG
jgi:hypothetical protein